MFSSCFMRADVRFHCFFHTVGQSPFLHADAFPIDVNWSISACIIRLTSDDVKRKIVIFLFFKACLLFFRGFIVNYSSILSFSMRLSVSLPPAIQFRAKLSQPISGSPSPQSAPDSPAIPTAFSPMRKRWVPPERDPSQIVYTVLVKIGLPQLRSVYSVCSSLCARWLFGLPRNSS